MKKFAIISMTTVINESSNQGFSGQYIREKGKTTVVRFLGIPVFKSSITIV